MAKRREVSGTLVDHTTGKSHDYVVRFRKVADDVLWSVRIKLSGRWIDLPKGRIRHAASEQDDFVISELVRDSVIESVYDADMDEMSARSGERPGHKVRPYSVYVAAALACLVFLLCAFWFISH